MAKPHVRSKRKNRVPNRTEGTKFCMVSIVLNRRSADASRFRNWFDLSERRDYHKSCASKPGDRCLALALRSAGLAGAGERKVRTPQGGVLANGEGRRGIPGDGAYAFDTESATENVPPDWRLRAVRPGKGEKVRSRVTGNQSKSAPLRRRRRRHGKPHTEQDQIGGEERPVPLQPSGRSLDPVSNCGARGMIATRFGGRQNSAYRLARVFSVL